MKKRKRNLAKMPGSGVHYGLRRLSSESLIEEMKPRTGDSCALCLDPILEERTISEKVQFLSLSSFLGHIHKRRCW